MNAAAVSHSRQVPSRWPFRGRRGGRFGEAPSLARRQSGSSGDSMKKAPRLLLAGVAILVGVASASVGRAENLSSAGTVTAVAGPVTVARLSATPQPLKFRDTLFWRDVVEARKDGIARILLGGKTTVTVRELSRLELREEGRADGGRYTLELGGGGGGGAGGGKWRTGGRRGAGPSGSGRTRRHGSAGKGSPSGFRSRETT